ncbi:unnamed protein product, partial [Aphanomyces euteiches]
MVAILSALAASLGVTYAIAHNHHATSCVDLQDDVDYPGNDVGSTLRDDPSDCCTDCAANDECKVWVWTSYQGGTCWLKSSKGEATGYGGAKSGSLPSPQLPSSYSNFENDTDYADNDISSTQRKYAADCATDCDQTNGCKVFVWTNFQGGTCWLKSSKGAKSFAPGALASVSRDYSPTETPGYPNIAPTETPEPTTDDGYPTLPPFTTTKRPKTTTKTPTTTKAPKTTKPRITTTAKPTTTKVPSTTTTKPTTTRTPTTTKSPTTTPIHHTTTAVPSTTPEPTQDNGYPTLPPFTTTTVPGTTTKAPTTVVPGTTPATPATTTVVPGTTPATPATTTVVPGTTPATPATTTVVP